ncbi:DUF3422 family protein [Microvirga ossetica]|uniref:DUF3422 family protein n=1 Tax=Microvirga ossetica TaxID=1882682 RepID=UPI00130006B0
MSANLVHFLFEGADAAGLHVGPHAATALAVPFALVGVARLVMRIRRDHSED